LLSAWQTGVWKTPSEFGGASTKAAFHRFEAEFRCCSQEVQVKKVDDFKATINRRQQAAGILNDDDAARPHNDQSDFDDDYLLWPNDELEQHSFVLNHIAARSSAAEDSLYPPGRREGPPRSSSAAVTVIDDGNDDQTSRPGDVDSLLEVSSA
jgi:hypothetical protein